MRTQSLSRLSLGILFIIAGANHFLSPEGYLQMMPSFLACPAALVAISGAAEILGGTGVLYSLSRRFAAWGLILLLIAVFPANIQAAMKGFHGGNLERAILIIRLPFQFVLIAWVYRSCLRKEAEDARAAPVAQKEGPEESR